MIGWFGDLKTGSLYLQGAFKAAKAEEHFPAHVKLLGLKPGTTTGDEWFDEDDG